MRLREAALKHLQDTPTTRLKIAIEMEVHPATVDRWVILNHRNLTMAAILKILEQESGLTELIDDGHE